MKISVDIDCTPEEARKFLGLPDVQPMQKAMMNVLEERMEQAVKASDPETLLKTWLPLGLQNFSELQKFFIGQMTNFATGDGRKPDGKK